MTYDITIHHPDRNVDYRLSVVPDVDSAGRYLEPLEVTLESMVTWFDDWGVPGAPETNIESKRAGEWVAKKFATEIDEAVRLEIEKSLEDAA
jgi:hypothetical protein